MTVTHRKRQHQPDEIQTVNEPGLQIQCDSCGCDLTHSIRMKCADPVCEPGDGVDICPACFCAGKEFAKHKRGHAYRVVELHSYPIFSEDWGADEELLLLEGISLQGHGNWQAISEHVGTRTKEEVEQHYNAIYVDSPDWPLPRMDVHFNIDPSEFQERKRRRIAAMNTAPPPPKVAPTSAPGVHEIATFLPGRLEFEHEVDNEAEDLVKDLEFGICLEWGGDGITEDENDFDVKARIKLSEDKKSGVLRAVSEVKGSPMPVSMPNGVVNGGKNGHSGKHGDSIKLEKEMKSEDVTMENGTGIDLPAATGPTSGTTAEPDPNADEITQPPPIESEDSLTFKLTLIEMYSQRIEKRREAKALIFDRGLLEYKKMQAAEKKRPKEEKDIVHRLRPFARLQTAEDYEMFSADMLYESMLRKKIQELQHYRRMGLTTAADIDKYESDIVRRTQAKANMSRDYYSSERLSQLRAAGGRQSSVSDSRRAHSLAGESDARKSHERELSPKPSNPGASASAIRRPRTFSKLSVYSVTLSHYMSSRTSRPC
ncbi:hypothetical protein PILCRDRAFT_823942 [Piloderma croceum F 1598]|uniref:Transcriptional adapter 2 n=1 Tax=Piloderma croceum (strain F 1598) TaxID=765440 RepID=A0A0C3BND2_PILCF|nr:hypothetical protein PILCRDRAFT_823942 [Piloderma croceum F 1598]